MQPQSSCSAYPAAAPVDPSTNPNGFARPMWSRFFIAVLTSLCLPIILRAADSPPEVATTVLSGEQIEQALRQQHPATRGLVPRGLTRRDGSDSEQSVNLDIPFASNSSALRPQATAQLKQLELALNSASLGKDRFVVAGHTDANGSAHYNKLLSLRRAKAVKRFLVAQGMDANRLDTVGYGSERLLAPDRPEDPANRRVEIRDLGHSGQ